MAYLCSSFSRSLGCSLTCLLAQLDTGNLAGKLVQVVFSVIKEAVDDLIPLTGTLRALLLGQQLLIGLPVMSLRPAVMK